MVTSEGGTSAEGSGAEQPGAAAPSDEDKDLQEIATFLVTTFVENATSAAVDFLQQTSKAFEESLNTALAGKYTASALAKDSAALWARNVRFLSQLFSVGVPGKPMPPSPDESHEGRAGPPAGRSS
jgi:hypothetical protein